MWTNERVQSGAAATAAVGGFGGTDGAELWKSEPKSNHQGDGKKGTMVRKETT